MAAIEVMTLSKNPRVQHLSKRLVARLRVAKLKTAARFAVQMAQAQVPVATAMPVAQGYQAQPYPAQPALPVAYPAQAYPAQAYPAQGGLPVAQAVSAPPSPPQAGATGHEMSRKDE